MSALIEPISAYESHILDLAWDGIFMLGLDGTIEFWNRGAEEMYGWTRAEAVGRISHQLLKTRFPYPLAKIMDELGRRGKWSGELGHTTKSGRELIAFGLKGQPMPLTGTDLYRSTLDLTAHAPDHMIEVDIVFQCIGAQHIIVVGIDEA